MKILLILAENSWKTEIKFSRSALFHMKTKVSLKNFVKLVSKILWMITVTLSQDIFKLVINFLRNFGWFGHRLDLTNGTFREPYIISLLPPTTHLNLFFSFSNLNLVFSFYYLQPTIKLTNTICLVQHRLKAFPGLDVESCFIYFYFSFFYLWFMSRKINIIWKSQLEKTKMQWKICNNN